MRRLVALVMALSLGSSIALSAQKPEKHKGKSQETQVTVVFIDTQREAARSYFVTQHGRGHCPPGLAKKNNGCLPPGQAKKLARGQRYLPSYGYDRYAYNQIPYDVRQQYR